MQVFEVVLKDDNYENIQYTDDYVWQDSDKKKIYSLIWNQILNSTDLDGQMAMDTANGTVLIKFKPYPSDSPKRRFKKVEGFLLQHEIQEVPQAEQINVIPAPPLETQKIIVTEQSDALKLKTYRIVFRNGKHKDIYIAAFNWVSEDNKIWFYKNNNQKFDSLIYQRDVMIFEE